LFGQDTSAGPQSRKRTEAAGCAMTGRCSASRVAAHHPPPKTLPHRCTPPATVPKPPLRTILNDLSFKTFDFTVLQRPFERFIVHQALGVAGNRLFDSKMDIQEQ
jgi:hypothetical protein